MTQSAANDTDIQRQIEQDYRWNFKVNAMDETSFWFGMSFNLSAIILPHVMASS